MNLQSCLTDFRDLTSCFFKCISLIYFESVSGLAVKHEMNQLFAFWLYCRDSNWLQLLYLHFMFFVFAPHSNVSREQRMKRRNHHRLLAS